MSEQHKNFSDEELRQACNDKTPHDAFFIALQSVHRMAVALESIAVSMQQPPTVLFEEVAPGDDAINLKS